MVFRKCDFCGEQKEVTVTDKGKLCDDCSKGVIKEEQ
jgi:hypothetical protein